MNETLRTFLTLLATSILSGSLMAAVLGFVVHRSRTRIEEQIRDQFRVMQSQRAWKERSVSELLGPVFMQLDRTQRAFLRWESKNLFLETKVIREGNLAIRDALLSKPHLIPPELQLDAAKLIEHYDRWLEEYERQRLAEEPDLESPFTFVGPHGYPFPREAEINFKAAFLQTWSELYGDERPQLSRAGVREASVTIHKSERVT
jgi:hypothetical protein